MTTSLSSQSMQAMPEGYHLGAYFTDGDLPAAPTAGPGEWVIRLNEAIPYPMRGDTLTTPEVFLEIDQQGLRRDLLGYASIRYLYRSRGPTFNDQDHEGWVHNIQPAGPNVWRIDLEMIFNPDPFTHGGQARYILEVTLGEQITGSWQRLPDAPSHPAFSGQRRLDEGTSGVVTGFFRPTPWRAVADGFSLPEPGEHPRLLFRREDLPTIRERANRPEGREIQQIMRDMMAERFSPWDAASAAFLYQITGDQADADLARSLTERLLAGEVDETDHRYWWREGKVLRHSGAVQALALAYDMAYDGWEPTFRERIAQELAREFMYIIRGGGSGLDFSPMRNWYGTFTARSAIGGMAVLGDVRDLSVGIRNDEHRPRGEQFNAFQARINSYLYPDAPIDGIAWGLRVAERRMQRYFEPMGGYGPRGWFAEGQRYSQLPANPSLQPYLLAHRNTTGTALTQHVRGDWLLLRWLYDVVERADDRPHYMRRSRAGGFDHIFNETGHSNGGQWAMGFPHVPASQHGATLWFHENVVREADSPPYGIGRMTHRGIWSILHWPFDVEPRNPAETLPRVLWDERKGYFVFRKQWRDHNDLVATVFFSNEGGARDAAPVYVWGLGMEMSDHLTGHNWTRYPMTEVDLYGARTTDFRTSADGSGLLHWRRVSPEHIRLKDDNRMPKRGAILVDYSEASGTPGLYALAWVRGEAQQDDPGVTIGQPSYLPRPGAELTLGHELDMQDEDTGARSSSLVLHQSHNAYFALMTLQNGEAPTALVLEPQEGEWLRVEVGERIVSWTGAGISVDGPSLDLQPGVIWPE